MLKLTINNAKKVDITKFFPQKLCKRCCLDFNKIKYDDPTLITKIGNLYRS